ncbi:MAG: hypothetical protein LBH73_01775 [Spirochaetaceae bacterium]|jgi:hypothetical protein|nr:hypothetical protein [Spirochaetaceae bacterium]
MITIEQTVDISAGRRLHLDLELPDTIPVGRTSVVLVFPTSERLAADNKETYHQKTSLVPTIEGLKAEAAAKYAKIRETGVDPWQQSREALQGKKTFGEDGVEYQRRMRDEWPD